MKRYIIERDMPGVGKLSADGLQHARDTSNLALSETGPGIQWVQSLITDNKIYCHYLAENKELVLEHARRTGFPASKISEVKSILDPVMATREAA